MATSFTTYTIVNAINDGNVLPFRIDFIDTIKEKDNIKDKQVSAIDIENAMMASKRISKVTQYFLEHFDQKTYRNQSKSYFNHRVIKNVEKVAGSKYNSN